ncbi:hypothetical protein DSBG_3100 [Desulfosporosinus sp. BG]|nr:hypothetical protein DSBG_3100 [Desulfosporosinus sp. BG]
MRQRAAVFLISLMRVVAGFWTDRPNIKRLVKYYCLVLLR